ncbi:peroxisomal membrane protein 11B-like [Ptychodera flava]|uniref:peroxisomal membrane protein 11B-like n=1 Tax=Ptychodera flava TaxID=63121 RepID=UPI00396A9230
MDVVTSVVKFNAQVSGRDKVCRFFQYGCKFTSWSLRRLERDEEFILKTKNLENALSATRKLLRFGKSVDLIQESLKTIHLSDIFLRVTITLSKLNTAIYLLVDHALWAEKVGLVELDKKYYRNLSARFWLATLILSLARDFYEIIVMVKNMSRLQNMKKDENEIRSCVHNSGTAGQNEPNGFIVSQLLDQGDFKLNLVPKCLQHNYPVALDTLKNGADIFLPLSSLGYLRLSSGLQGILGMISSVVGIMTVWDGRYKLKP